MIIIPSRNSESLASKVAASTGGKLSGVERRRFPDGEMYLRILENIRNEEVIVIGNIRSDSDFLELLFMVNAAREGGAKKVTAVVPYYGYSRQHKIYHEGEPVSSKVITRAIEEFSDRIICVEIHDPETIGFSSVPFENLSVIDTASNYYRDRNIDLVLSPDDGGFDRAKKMAAILGVPAYYIDKKRIDSKTVEMNLPKVDFSGKSILIVDDMISTGGTIIKAVKLLKDSGVARVSVNAVHGVFARESDRNIESIVDELVVTDTIDSVHSVITVAADISRAIIGE